MSKEDRTNQAWEAYEKIKGALDGLYEILKMSFSNENIFYQCGVDNLEELKETIIDLLSHDYNNKEVKERLRELEFDVKKRLFFEENQNKRKD
ncbi:MAG: hypothetical protein KGD63_11795 [Candidatus Lokiarchaeota archaeon]|nr:hypothetical protein [Candidatus Lokiarchaeota archaeon]